MSKILSRPLPRQTSDEERRSIQELIDRLELASLATGQIQHAYLSKDDIDDLASDINAHVLHIRSILLRARDL